MRRCRRPWTTARAEGAAYVVAMAHLGIEGEQRSLDVHADVIANTTGINALLDGHSHSILEQEKVKNKDGEEVLLARACGTKLASHWLRCAFPPRTAAWQTGLYKWDTSNTVSLPDLIGLDNDSGHEGQRGHGHPEREAGRGRGQEPTVDLVITDPETDDENGQPVRVICNAETNLGDLCADAYRDQSGADIAFVNGGGIRVKIAAGDITLNDILEGASLRQRAVRGGGDWPADFGRAGMGFPCGARAKPAASCRCPA